MFRTLTFFIMLLTVVSLSWAEEINLYADRIMADKEKGYIYAEGNVYVTMGDLSLWTKSLLYDEETSNIYAFEKVVFYGGFLANGEYLKYNLKTKEGYLSKGEVSFLSEDPKKRRFLWGEDIVVKDKETFVITKGGMSSCDGEKKAWHIEGKKINVELGEYLTSKDTTLYASSLPLLYTPYFVAPIKKERESGFLIPSFGFSGKNGFILNLPYYTVLDDSRDITNTLIIKSKTTVGLDNQFRYMLSEQEKGEIDIALIDNFDINKTFFEGKFEHAKENEKENLKVKIDYVNRKDYFTLYASDSYDKTKPYTRSIGFYERNSRRDIYEGELFFSQDMSSPSRDLRYITFKKDGYIRQYGDKGYNFNASLSAFSVTGEETRGRVLAEPFFVYRKVGENKGFYSKVSLLLSDYLNSSDEKDNKLKGIASVDFLGYLDKKLLVNDKYKVVNTFSADINLPYRLNGASAEVFDKNDILDETKKIRYRYDGKWYELSGLKQRFYLSLWQDYIISGDENRENYFSDLFFVSRLTKNDVALNVNGSYNHSANRMREVSISGNVKKERFYTAASYYRNEDGEEFLNLDLSSKLGYNTTVIAGTRYDIKKDIAREVTLGTELQRSCYSVKIVVTRKDLPREYLMMFTLNLFGLGEFKQGY
ncbi:MAG: hypothetical protein OHK0040_07920 [bacterium]